MNSSETDCEVDIDMAASLPKPSLLAARFLQMVKYVWTRQANGVMS
jgi:hypothetical protein